MSAFARLHLMGNSRWKTWFSCFMVEGVCSAYTVRYFHFLLLFLLLLFSFFQYLSIYLSLYLSVNSFTHSFTGYSHISRAFQDQGGCISVCVSCGSGRFAHCHREGEHTRHNALLLQADRFNDTLPAIQLMTQMTSFMQNRGAFTSKYVRNGSCDMKIPLIGELFLSGEFPFFFYCFSPTHCSINIKHYHFMSMVFGK